MIVCISRVTLTSMHAILRILCLVYVALLWLYHFIWLKYAETLFYARVCKEIATKNYPPLTWISLKIGIYDHHISKMLHICGYGRLCCNFVARYIYFTVSVFIESHFRKQRTLIIFCSETCFGHKKYCLLLELQLK